MKTTEGIWFWREDGRRSHMLKVKRIKIMGNEKHGAEVRSSSPFDGAQGKSLGLTGHQTPNPPVLLVKAKTGEVYEQTGEMTFKNLTTGKEGEMTRELAMKHMKMPVKLNYMIDKNPALLEVIRKFGCAVVMGQEP